MLLRMRRFYRAFYQWTLITSSAPSCPRFPAHARHVAQAAATSTHPGNGKNLFRRVNRKQLHWSPTNGFKIQPDRQDGTRRAQQEDSSWKHEDAVSSEQKPFNTLKPWEQVVRYNSFAGVILQMAVPAETLRLLRKEHGSLKEIAEKFGADFEEGQKSTHVDEGGQAVALRAALISGSHDQVNALRMALKQTREIATRTVRKQGAGTSVNTPDRSAAAPIEQNPNGRAEDDSPALARDKKIDEDVGAAPLIAEGTPVQQSSGDQSLKEDLKKCLRCLTHPVAIVTALRPLEHWQDERKRREDLIAKSHAVTVSSLTAVTFTPDPIISFNLKLPSRTWDAIETKGAILVHLLASSPTAAALAHIFTQPYADSAEPFRIVDQMKDVTVGPSQSRASARRTGSPSRVQLDGKAIMARLKVDLLRASCTRVADHMIVVGKVQHIQQHDVSTARGLAYAMQSYRGMGKQIQPAELQTILKKADSLYTSHSGNEASTAARETSGGTVPSSRKRDESIQDNTQAGLRQGDQPPLEDRVSSGYPADDDDGKDDEAEKRFDGIELDSPSQSLEAQANGDRESSEQELESIYERMSMAPKVEEDVGDDVEDGDARNAEDATGGVEERQQRPLADTDTDTERAGEKSTGTATTPDSERSRQGTPGASGPIRGPPSGGAWGL